MELTVGLIGLGLIGGSIAKALKKTDSSIYIMAYNRSDAPLAQAFLDGTINEIAQDIDDSFNKCDIIFLCTPVEFNSTYMPKVAAVMNDKCILTDVGSVKGHIHNSVKELGLEHCFVGGHPMAGSEKTGYAASSDILLENAYFVITPTEQTTNEQLDLYVSIVEKTGAIPLVIKPDIHDYAVAGISHVPHLIASALVNMVRENDTPDELMKLIAAGGFKDITRIASSSPEVWSQICTTNSKQISIILGKYIEMLTEVKKYVDEKDSDAIHNMFYESREYRNSISINTKGPVLARYTLFCDIEDKEGSLNSITHLLSVNHISIKNIEIIHNREFKQGALLTEFYDEPSLISAKEILRGAGYQIFC